MRTLRFVVLFAFFMSFSLAGVGQQPTGSIVGTVTDQTGAVVPGVEVTLRHAETSATRRVTTSDAGRLEFLLLRPGTYELKAEAKGFRRMVQQNIVLNVGEVVTVNLALEVGAMTQTVEVSAQPPLIEPDKTTISSAIDPRAIKNLPLQGRQFLNLVLATPGTVPQAPGTQAGGFSVAGMRSQSNNFTLDGISNNDPQVNGPLNNFRIADAVQEFSVQTSIASTDVGRNSGAQVSIVTKGGGNNYHGSLFYYGRNDVLDAAPFFLNRAGQPKNELRRHQYGGTAGGRIRRDKTFWFFSYEGFRQVNPRPQTARVPTPAERAQVIDPVSQKLLQFWPPPNTPLIGGRNWAGTAPNLDNNTTYFARIDHSLADNHRVMGRYAWFQGSTLSQQTNPFNGNITNKPTQHSAIFQDTYNSSRMVNEFKLGFSRNTTFFQPGDVNINPASIFTDTSGNPLPGFIDTSKDSLDGGLPRITVTGFSNFGLGAGTNMPQGRSTNTYEAIENLTLTSPLGWSRHTLRFGAHARHEITNRFLNGNYRGFISFANWTRFANGEPRTGSLRTGEGGTFRTWSRQIWYFYAQDTFKPRSNLTLNYGIRYELPGQSREKYNRGSNFVPAIGQMALNSSLRIDIDPTKLGRSALFLTPVGTALPRSGQFQGAYKNFGPFLGIAWSPKVLPGLFGGGKTVIRTGFRLGYDDIFANIPVNMGLNFPPLLSTALPPRTSAPFYSWGTVLSQDRSFFSSDPTVPEGSRGILGFNAWDTDGRSAYAMNYALEVERQLGRDVALEVSYVGTQGRKLGVFVDPNQPFVTINDPTKHGDQAPNVRIFPFRQYRSIGLGTFVSNSNYNGMIVSLRKRTSHGVTFNGSYDFGRSMDDNSSFFGSDRDNGSYADTRNRRLDRGRSGFDIRHRVILSYIAELPVGPGRGLLGGTHGVLGQAVGGWQISGVTTYRTGFPFTVFAGTSTDFSGLNQFTDRPNFASGVTSLKTDMSNPEKAFDPKAFVSPVGGSVGFVSRNLFTGPSALNFDFGLFKNFPFGEKRRVIQFRAEFFNLLNHAQFDLPSSNLESSAAGTIGGAADPRLIQLGLRLDW